MERRSRKSCIIFRGSGGSGWISMLKMIKGRVFDVEMQKRNRGNIPKRTRFYQALIDAPMLKSGEQGFDHLKPAYIIVICGFDQYGYGFYRYTFDNRCKELPELLMGDGCRKIILNTKGDE